MGKAARWFKGLLGGGKKEKDKNEGSSSNLTDRKEKKRWSFGKSNRDVGQFPGSFHGSDNVPPPEAAWLRSYYGETEEQNRHAIAVAAATAAAADAAVAAAQAAVAVVRLTSHGRGTMFGGGRERWAAVKIQTVFRGYLEMIISILSNMTNVNISSINCGPGHGISIGSLGEKNTEAQVSDVHVEYATFTNTQNGVRIKTWQDYMKKEEALHPLMFQSPLPSDHFIYDPSQ